MKIHIIDQLDKLLKEYTKIYNKEPTKLYMTINDLTELKEHLNLDYLDEFKKWHGCKLKVSDKITKSFYE